MVAGKSDNLKFANLPVYNNGGISFVHSSGGAYAALSGLEEEHSEKVRQYKRALKQAENIINGIASLRMRTLVMMLYVEDIPAREVRERLNMSRRRFHAAVEAIEQAEDMAHVRWRENAFSEE